MGMDEAKLQEAAGEMVRRDVLVCQSRLVDELLSQGLAFQEDMQNETYWIIEVDGEEKEYTDWDEVEELEEALIEESAELQELIDNLEDKLSEVEHLAEGTNERYQAQAQHGLTRAKKTRDVLDRHYKAIARYKERILEARERLTIVEDGIADINMRQLEPEHREVLEWWAVSDWLKARLLEKGELFLETEWGDWWGRTCGGQAIKMDGPIREITEECYM